jgi:hypothetical protein
MEKRNTYKILVGKPEGKRPLRRPWCRWEDINIDLSIWGVDWIQMFQDRDHWWALVNMVMYLQFP